MIDANDNGGRETRRTSKSYLWDLAAAIIIGLLSFGAFIALDKLARQVPAANALLGDDQKEYRRDLRSYVWGISLALVLTLVPFALVYWSAMPRFWLLIAIGAFALTQVVVHFRFFLHIDPPNQKVDDLQLILFSSLILFVMASGTIWIMANLAMRMH